MSPASEANDDVRRLFGLLEALREDKRRLDDDIKQIEDELGDTLGAGPTFLDGRTLRRHKRRPRTRNWDNTNLLRVVLDSRLLDKETGELVEEDTLTKLRAVFGLKGYNASLRQLEDRGIDPGEFCEKEDVPGWSIEAR